MIHYWGTPISPKTALYEMGGRNFCVRYGAHGDLQRAHEVGQSVMLDNGAFSFWRDGVETSPEWWSRYADWVRPWLDYKTTWCVIPDVIDGTVEDNDQLIYGWPRDLFSQSAPVFHLHEPLDRLKYLVNAWGRVCIGSSGIYEGPKSNAWKYRMDEVWNAILPGGGGPPCWIHMLRAMEQACDGDWPFASADSTNVAQNHHRHASPVRIAQDWDYRNPPPRWLPREQMELACSR